MAKFVYKTDTWGERVKAKEGSTKAPVSLTCSKLYGIHVS